jgi:hypothetical protein
MAGEDEVGCLGCFGFIYVVGYLVAVLVVWQQTHSFGKTLVYPLGSWLTVFFGMGQEFNLW